MKGLENKTCGYLGGTIQPTEPPRRPGGGGGGEPFKSEERTSTKVLRQELAGKIVRKLGAVCSWNRVSKGKSDRRMESEKQLGDGL